MSVTIGRLRVRASIPRRLRALASAVDDAARREFTPALRRARAGHAPAPAVCRIRQLRIRLQVTPDDVRRSRLSDLWAEAFERALTAAVANPGGVDLIIAESRAHWIAQFLLRLLQGEPVDGWAYREFSQTASLMAADAITDILETNAAHAHDVLTILDGGHHLARLIAALTDTQIRRVVGVLDRSQPPSPRAIDVHDLSAVARLVLEGGRETLDRRLPDADSRAIALFIAQRRLCAFQGQPLRPPARIRDALHVIEWMCGLRRVMPGEESTQAIAAVLARLRHGLLPPTDAPLAVLLPLLSRPVADPRDGDADAARTLGDMIDRVLSEVPSTGAQAARQLTGRSIDSGFASLLLLVPAVLRLGWQQRIRTSACWGEQGPRALTYTLAGAALAIAGRPPELAGVDPGLLLFAGWTGEPDVRGFRRWLEGASVDERRDLLVSLLPADESRPDAWSSWESAFRAVAHALVRRFADDLRGFRHSSDRFIIERFLSTPGRVLIEPDRLLVSLAPNALWIAVHLSGADSPVHSAGWLGDRRVEFELGGL
jgi:hypothetical protein